jgi:hypothetical protein
VHSAPLGLARHIRSCSWAPLRPTPKPCSRKKHGPAKARKAWPTTWRNDRPYATRRRGFERCAWRTRQGRHGLRQPQQRANTSKDYRAKSEECEASLTPPPILTLRTATRRGHGATSRKLQASDAFGNHVIDAAVLTHHPDCNTGWRPPAILSMPILVKPAQQPD